MTFYVDVCRNLHKCALSQQTLLFSVNVSERNITGGGVKGVAAIDNFRLVECD